MTEGTVLTYTSKAQVVFWQRSLQATAFVPHVYTSGSIAAGHAG
jgi:hypothetical protein